MSLLVNQLFGVAGKTVLVTGGGRGIGRMIAEGFVANGATVFISSRDTVALDGAASELTAAGAASGGRCISIAANLGSRGGCEELAAAMAELLKGGGLHCLVNNSGTSWGEPLERKSGRLNWGWDRVLDLNLKAPFYLTRALLPSLEATASSADPARVINIGSVAGLTAQDFPTHAYDSSKAAVHALTKKLAHELARRTPDKPVTVNAIAPGYVPSKMTQGLAAWGVDQEQAAAAIPLGRMGAASDMAGAALFLASPAGAWVTGAVLPVDGGSLAAPLAMMPDGE